MCLGATGPHAEDRPACAAQQVPGSHVGPGTELSDARLFLAEAAGHLLPEAGGSQGCFCVPALLSDSLSASHLTLGSLLSSDKDAAGM